MMINQMLSDLKNLITPKKITVGSVPFMPAKECDFLTSAILNSETMLEYGSGGSTIFALLNNVRIVSVESDRKFYTYMYKRISEYKNHNIKLLYADVGITGAYGVPIFSELRTDISKLGLKYVQTGFSDKQIVRPDLIFVDGRWRVACCLYPCLLFETVPDIYLDDYESNRSYHIYISKYFEIDVIGRLARLIYKKNSNKTQLIDDFVTCLNNPS